MGAILFAMLAAVLTAWPGDARDFRSSDIYSVEHPRAARSMADDLKQRSGGKLSIGDLGEDSDFTESHSRSISIVVFSKRVWDTLGADQQRLIKDAEIASVDQHRRMRSHYETAGCESLRATGVSVIEDVDRSSFAKAIRAWGTRYVTDRGARDMVAKIRAADSEMARE